MTLRSRLTALLVLVTLILGACGPQAETTGKVAGSTPGTEASAGCVVTPPSEPMACTMDWRPVCGCDGVTYSNACSAKAAGVPEHIEGECKDKGLD